MAAFTIRLATTEDVQTLVRHRCEMFKDMGRIQDDCYQELHGASVGYFIEAIPAGEYVAWVVCDGEAIVGGGGMLIGSLPPRPGPDGALIRPGPQGLIMNVFVEQAYRRRGIAESILKHIIGFAKGSGIPTLALHASEAGRPLYERLGFKPTSEMRLILD